MGKFSEYGEIVSIYFLPDYIGKGYGNHVVRLLQHLARTIQNRLEDERKSKENQTDKKLRRIIDAKREAHGLKHG